MTGLFHMDRLLSRQHECKETIVCLAIPAKVTTIDEDNLATVDILGSPVPLLWI